MKQRVRLEALLPKTEKEQADQVALFAVLSLGVIELLTNGVLSATGAVRLFFNADNCLFVRKRLRGRIPEQIMSHGVQLPDLFEVLPAEDAHREFQRELAILRSLCLRLLGDRQRVA